MTSMPKGTSTTVMFAERYRYCNPSGGGHTDPLWTANPWSTPNGPWAIPAFGWTTAQNNGANELWGGSGYYPDYNDGAVPFQAAPSPAACDWRVTQGGHTGGMVVGLGDGSGRIVNPGMSVNTWVTACWPGTYPTTGGIVGSDW